MVVWLLTLLLTGEGGGCATGVDCGIVGPGVGANTSGSGVAPGGVSSIEVSSDAWRADLQSFFFRKNFK